MKSTLKYLFLVASMSFFLAPTTVSAETCITKTGWYVPYNCTLIGKTATGKLIMTCCS